MPARNFLVYWRDTQEVGLEDIDLAEGIQVLEVDNLLDIDLVGILFADMVEVQSQVVAVRVVACIPLAADDYSYSYAAQD